MGVQCRSMIRSMNMARLWVLGAVVIGLVGADYAPTGPYPPASYNNVNMGPSATGGGEGGAAAGGGGVIGGGGVAGGGVIGGGGVVGGGISGPGGPGPFLPGAPFFPGPGGPFPLPPFGPSPPPFGLLPWGPPGSFCNALDTLRHRLTALSRPLMVAGLGAALFWAVKTILLPNIAIFASLFKRRMGVDRDDLDRISEDVSRAINNGVCYEKIACSFGRIAAARFPIIKHFLRIISLSRNFWLSNYFEIFRIAAIDDTNDVCTSYQCGYNEILPSR